MEKPPLNKNRGTNPESVKQDMLPESTANFGELTPQVGFKSWPQFYTLVLVFNAVLITSFYLFMKYFS